ncbi:hypothetical protein CBM2609_B30292 [Cupriavidus taiwanensis]|nr:hypothetical protein CBM2604_B40290 [Cupriavidus taiwanensis]SOZ32612.1 hypothetical protein CBM2609_B30292 [Cupriavidus taiwanensis]SOZ48209.1 hypothetical protein CBM2610_B30290 [Cupriavidus taiwanensis]
MNRKVGTSIARSTWERDSINGFPTTQITGGSGIALRVQRSVEGQFADFCAARAKLARKCWSIRHSGRIHGGLLRYRATLGHRGRVGWFRCRASLSRWSRLRWLSGCRDTPRRRTNPCRWLGRRDDFFRRRRLDRSFCVRACRRRRDALAHLANALAFALHVMFASNYSGVRRSPHGD